MQTGVKAAEERTTVFHKEKKNKLKTVFLGMKVSFII